jgi:hypothetical protein
VKQKVDSVFHIDFITSRDTIPLQIDNGYVEIPMIHEKLIEIIVRYKDFSKRITGIAYKTIVLEPNMRYWAFGIMQAPYSEEFVKHFPYYSHLPKVFYWMREDEDFSYFFYYSFHEDLYIIEEAKEED